MSIEIHELKHTYNDNTALRTSALKGISLSLQRDGWTSIIGHTGSGKSTLAQHLNAILRPTDGYIDVEGTIIRPVNEKKRVFFSFGAKKEKRISTAMLRDVRRRVGLIFQYPEQQLFEETVRAEIAFAPRNWGVPEVKIDALVLNAVRAVGLDENYLDRSPFGLSGGEKRRVAIASVLASSPDYLVLDEPTAGLDLRGRSSLLRLLDRIHSQGTGIVLVTHDLEIAFSRSDNILMLYGGECAGYGTPGEIAQQLYDHPVPGLIVPDVMLTALKLRERGVKVPLTCDPDRLADAIIKARRNVR